MIVVENVCDVSVVGALTGLLTRMTGYSIRSGILEPRTIAAAPVARDRHFWVMVRQ